MAMALCYKKLWHQLIDHDMTRSDSPKGHKRGKEDAS